AKHGQVVRAKLPGNSQSENITLKMGMTISPTMWKWFKEVESGNWAEQRRDGALTIYSQKGDVEALFHFFGAWPVSYKIGDVKADSTDFEIEEVELAVDEFIRVNTNGQAF
ncbi:MAG: phage tail protein, partial [Cyanobacteria bacterium J06642_11]